MPEVKNRIMIIKKVHNCMFFSCDGIDVQILGPKGKVISNQYYRDVKLINGQK